MDVNRVGQGHRIAAVAAIVLFIVMFFSWYGVDFRGVSVSADAWEAFDWVDLFLLLTVIVTLAAAAAVALGRAADLPVSAGAVTAGFGALATLLVLYRLLNEPGPDKLLDIKIGAWLGLIASAVVAYGGWRAMNEDDTRAPAAPAAPTPPPAEPPPAATA